MRYPIPKKDRKSGEHYRLTYTQPMYNKFEHRYLPDNFRFVDPTIRNVAYGGICKDGKRYCAICGRKGGDMAMFLDLESFTELFLSPHCLAHDSTQLWDAEATDGEISKWYERESLMRGYKAGEPLAGAAVMFGILEDEEYWEDDE